MKYGDGRKTVQQLLDQRKLSSCSHALFTRKTAVQIFSTTDAGILHEVASHSCCFTKNDKVRQESKEHNEAPEQECSLLVFKTTKTKKSAVNTPNYHKYTKQMYYHCECGLLRQELFSWCYLTPVATVKGWNVWANFNLFSHTHLWIFEKCCRIL